MKEWPANSFHFCCSPVCLIWLIQYRRQRTEASALPHMILRTAKLDNTMTQTKGAKYYAPHSISEVRGASLWLPLWLSLTCCHCSTCYDGYRVSTHMMISSRSREAMTYAFRPETTFGTWSLSSSTPPTALSPRTFSGDGSWERKSGIGWGLVGNQRIARGKTGGRHGIERVRREHKKEVRVNMTYYQP